MKYVVSKRIFEDGHHIYICLDREGKNYLLYADEVAELERDGRIYN